MWLKASESINYGGVIANVGEINEKNCGLRGRPRKHWMVVSIQASVSGSIGNFFHFYACFDCVVIYHRKGGDGKEHGPIRS